MSSITGSHGGFCKEKMYAMDLLKELADSYRGRPLETKLMESYQPKPQTIDQNKKPDYQD